MNWFKKKPDVLLIGENRALLRKSFTIGERRFVREYDSLDYVTILRDDGATSGEMVTYEGKTFGLNFGVIPEIPSKHVEGAFVLQLKFKAF